MPDLCRCLAGTLFLKVGSPLVRVARSALGCIWRACHVGSARSQCLFQTKAHLFLACPQLTCPAAGSQWVMKFLSVDTSAQVEGTEGMVKDSQVITARLPAWGNNPPIDASSTQHVWHCLINQVIACIASVLAAEAATPNTHGADFLLGHHRH